MPTPTVAADKMSVGSRSGGKHWTKAEVESRAKAAEGTKRKTRIVMPMPDWLDEDAQIIWKRIRRQVANLELLDNLDSDLLAIYCDTVAKYKRLASGLIVMNEDGFPVANEDRIKSIQAYARLAKSLADTLGFTPAARARLAKKKADEILDEFEESFGG